MNFKELLLTLTAVVGLFFAVPALAADANGDEGDKGGRRHHHHKEGDDDSE